MGIAGASSESVVFSVHGHKEHKEISAGMQSCDDAASLSLKTVQSSMTFRS